MREQKSRHQGGNKWIGTAGTSPFGAYGYNPEGVRIGQERNRNFRAVKVWDRREFKDLDDPVELGTRNIKIALRRLRKFARTGAPEELDLHGTITRTAHKGYLDILMRPERHNAVKVLLFFDVGGSMDWHIKATEELFSAARTSSSTWSISISTIAYTKRSGRKIAGAGTTPLPNLDLLHTYPHDYKVIFVGDASMSPVRDHGTGRLRRAFQSRKAVRHGWSASCALTLPASGSIRLPNKEWGYTQSIAMMRQLMSGRMYPLTLDGLDRAMRELVR